MTMMKKTFKKFVDDRSIEISLICGITRDNFLVRRAIVLKKKKKNNNDFHRELDQHRISSEIGLDTHD